jgi:hypothetical protein
MKSFPSEISFFLALADHSVLLSVDHHRFEQLRHPIVKFNGSLQFSGAQFEYQMDKRISRNSYQIY